MRHVWARWSSLCRFGGLLALLTGALAAMGWGLTRISGDWGTRAVGWLVIGEGVGCFALTLMWARRVAGSLCELESAVQGVITGKGRGLHVADCAEWDVAKVGARVGELAEALRISRQSHELSLRAFGARTATVNRLLEFSQAIQGAGKAEQIFQTLCHFLKQEFGLTSAVLLTHEAGEALPITTVRAQWPETLVKADRPISEMEAGLCPCLRQKLPRCFGAESTIRCSVEQSLDISVQEPAYCVPFQVGRTMQAVVHMTLPVGETWTEERQRLSQAYVNTAHSTLISLHLLAEAEKQSLTDPLTGLFNRRSMEQLMIREVALSERHGHALTVVMIDMDHFKEINDTLGHAAGDHLLRSFADCVRITLRKTDLAFRYGGDEFVIALPQTPMAQAEQVVQKLRQAFATVDFSSAIARLERQPTLSIGVAERSKVTNILTLENLMSAADQALYEAKKGERNCVRAYQPPRAA